LWKQLADEESEAQLKRLHFQDVQKKAAAEVRRRLEPKIKSNTQPYPKHLLISSTDPGSKTVEKNINTAKEGEGDGVLALDQEFWSQFFGFKTEGDETPENSGPDVWPTNTNSQPKPPLNPFYSRLHLTIYDKIKVRCFSVT